MSLLTPYVPSITPPDPPDSSDGGSGSPEGVKIGSPYQRYVDTDTDEEYYKKTGEGTNTGWELISGTGGGGGGDLSTTDINTSLKIKNIVSDETGSGALVFANSPTLVDPVIEGEMQVGDEADEGDIQLGDGNGNNFSLAAPTFESLPDGATITQTMTTAKLSQNAKVTIADDRTLAFTGLVNGMSGILVVTQGTGGGHALTLPAGSVVINDGGSEIELSAAEGDIDVLSWAYDGTNILWTYGKNFT